MAAVRLERREAGAPVPAGPGMPAEPSGSGGRLGALRRLLAEKFPQAEVKPGVLRRTGVEALDRVEGGLRSGVVTEVSSSPGNGALFLDVLLRTVVRERLFAALVDAGGTFDPEGCDPAVLPRLLRVSCADAGAAVKAADLLLRDGNCPLLVLDLQGLPLREAAGVSAGTWHRFQRLAEQSATAFVILTVRPFVESAQVRVLLHNRWSLQAQREDRNRLAERLDVQVVPRHRAAPALRVVSPSPV